MIIYQGEAPYDINETLIYINPTRHNAFSGYIEHPASGQIWLFDSVFRLLSIHESLFDSLDSTQHGNLVRQGGPLDGTDWSQNKDIPVYARGDLFLPDQPTFAVHVLYRQNASWQGTLRSIKCNTISRFRSTLEMLLQMENALLSVSVGK